MSCSMVLINMSKQVRVDGSSVDDEIKVDSQLHVDELPASPSPGDAEDDAEEQKEETISGSDLYEHPDVDKSTSHCDASPLAGMEQRPGVEVLIYLRIRPIKDGM